MLLSRTSQYALQALVYMATQRPEMPILSRDIALKIDVSATYLAKVLQNLSRHGLLNSYRGKKGGFSLDDSAFSTRLMQVVSLVEGPLFLEDCPLGLRQCSATKPCPIYTTWNPIKENLVSILEQLTIEEMAKSVISGRFSLADLPGSLLGQ
ncbi:MAG TPA: Rrf2 family transcriptional regulator [Parasulfuritortus sp.]